MSPRDNNKNCSMTDEAHFRVFMFLTRCLGSNACVDTLIRESLTARLADIPSLGVDLRKIAAK